MVMKTQPHLVTPSNISNPTYCLLRSTAPTIKVSPAAEDTAIGEVEPEVAGQVTALTLPATAGRGRGTAGRGGRGLEGGLTWAVPSLRCPAAAMSQHACKNSTRQNCIANDHSECSKDAYESP